MGEAPAEPPQQPQVLFKRRCKACGRMLAFVRTAQGKAAPMEVDDGGRVTEVNHFQTCSDPKRFSRGQRHD